MRKLKSYTVPAGEPNIIDRFLARTFLRLIPKKITPNQITTFRYISIPVILFLLVYKFNILGIILFVISAFSDAVDGALARTRDQITDWGKIHDPFADKLLIGSVGALIVSIYLNIYLISTIIGIEIILILNAFWHLKKGEKPIGALLPGKLKMILQCFGVGLILLYAVWPIAWFLLVAQIMLYAAIFFALISLIVYSSI
ncbi:MAG: CDP-alcohol phosphatidyltransferase family protein [Patescibacteria group bacterium]